MTDLNIRPVDSVEVTDLADRILAFKFTDDEKKTAKATITIRNTDRRFHQSDLWRPGTLFDVSWGAEGLTGPSRRMVVPKGQPRGPLNKFTVELHEVGVLMATEPRGTKRFDDVTYADVARTLASEHGFAEAFVFVADTATRYPSVTRLAAESDAVFLRRLATLQQDVRFWLDHTGFHFGPRDLEQPPVAKLGLGDIIGEVKIDAVKPDRPARVRHASRDADKKTTTRVLADNLLDSARPGLGPVLAVGTSIAQTAEILGLDTAKLLDVGRSVITAPPTRRFVRVDPDTLEETDVYSQVPPRATQEERVAGSSVKRSARGGDDDARAKGAYRDAVVGAVGISFKTRGNAFLLAKRIVEVDVGDEMLSQRYFVLSTGHTLRDGNNGYTTSLKLISDGHGGRSVQGSTEFPLAAERRSSRNTSQDFERAERVLQTLQAALALASGLGADVVAIRRQLDRDLQRVRAKKDGSILRAEKTVARLQKLSKNSPALSAASTFAAEELAKSRRGETSSNARVSTSNESGADLQRFVSVDPDTGTEVVQWRNRR